MRESKKNSKNNKIKSKITEKEENIKVEKLEKIEKEINESKNKGNERNEKKYKEAIKNIAVGCIIIIYFALLLFGNGKISNIDYIKTLKVVIILDVIVSIILLEFAFKKDKINIGLHGIEMAFVGGFTIFILQLFGKGIQSINKWFSIIIGTVAVYYIAKAIVIFIRKDKAN